MAAESSHGQVIVAVGVATVADTIIGTIEVPQRDTPWLINSIMGQIARQTGTAAEALNGNFGFGSPLGDLTPAPDPSRYLIKESCSLLGSVSDVSSCPLHKYDQEILIAGKGNVGFNVQAAIAPAVAPIWAVGIHYAPDIVVPKRAMFANRVRTTVTATTRTQVGTITLSEKATEIVGIIGHLTQDGVLTTAEELIGFFDISSQDISVQPSDWLFNEVYGAGLGATIAGGEVYPPMPHLVSIPVPGGARIDCFVTLETAVTNGADVEICLLYR